MRRLFKVIKSWFNKAVDELEDPVLMAEQSIRELKDNLNSCYDALAQVKAQKLTEVQERSEAKEESEGYLKQASWIKNTSEKIEKDRELAAKEALTLKVAADLRIQTADENIILLNKLEKDITNKISKLKNSVSEFERELKTLKIRNKMNKVSSDIRLSTSSIDYESSINTIKRMQEKVKEQSNYNEAYLEVEEQYSDKNQKVTLNNTKIEELYNSL